MASRARARSRCAEDRREPYAPTAAARRHPRRREGRRRSRRGTTVGIRAGKLGRRAAPGIREVVDMRCEGKSVLVTGAQRGIGRAVAIRFAGEGADIALNYLDDKPAAEAAAAEIAGLGRRCCIIEADVSKPEQARRLVMEAERDLGPIDVLVNNAGIFPRAPFLELAEAQWDAV